MKDDTVFLHHILDAIANIESDTVEGKEVFFRNRTIRDAVIRNIEIMGEATKNLSARLRDQNPQIDWKGMAGMRDVLIHQYFGVNIRAVWDAVENDLPKLKPELTNLLAQLEGPLRGGNHAQGED